MFKRILSSLLLSLATCTSVTPLPVPTLQPTSTFTPQPTSTLQPTVMPSATPNKGASPNWLLPMVGLQDWHMGFVSGAEWANNSTFNVFDQKDGRFYSFDASSGKSLPVLTRTPYRAPVESLSPSKAYKITCAPTAYKMQHVADGKLISESTIDFPDCQYVEWAPNSSAASLVASDGKVYVWRVDGSAPFIVGTGWVGAGDVATRAFWSPDSSKMTVLRKFEEPEFKAMYVSYNIVYADGRPMFQTNVKLEAGNGWWPYGVPWITNDIVSNSRQCGAGCYYNRYYDVVTGAFITGYTGFTLYSPYSGAIEDLSPDKRWLVFYTDGITKSTLVLYDLKTRKNYFIVNDSHPFSSPYQIVRWSSLSCCFFYIRYPFDVQITQAKEPVGLISFDVTQMSPWVMIPNALVAQWNVQDDSVFAITFGTADMKLETFHNVEAAIYSTDGKKISSLPLASEMQYEYLATFRMPFAQSNAKNNWVVRDGANGLWLINDKGQIKQIASGLPVDESLNTTQFSWSPDDRYLLVYRNDRAWVVDMKAVK
ncbi:hypothetical protein HY772_08110 [Candidatus Woesearchaeota archaeon]|nr:hypothetical protein [Candidatus Woesearchaeota archaeon]